MLNNSIKGIIKVQKEFFDNINKEGEFKKFSEKEICFYNDYTFSKMSDKQKQAHLDSIDMEIYNDDIREHSRKIRLLNRLVTGYIVGKINSFGNNIFFGDGTHSTIERTFDNLLYFDEDSGIRVFKSIMYEHGYFDRKTHGYHLDIKINFAKFVDVVFRELNERSLGYFIEKEKDKKVSNMVKKVLKLFKINNNYYEFKFFIDLDTFSSLEEDYYKYRETLNTEYFFYCDMVKFYELYKDNPNYSKFLDNVISISNDIISVLGNINLYLKKNELE